MKRITYALAIIGAVVPVQAQYGRSGVNYRGSQGTQIRQSGGFQSDRRDGKCTIRVRVDDQADIVIRGDRVYISVISGGPGRDEGSECNAYLPTSGNISNFQFQGVDGRGSVRLVQEPRSSNRYAAIVNIQDSKGGEEGYTFDLTWQWDGSGNPGSGGSGGGFFPGGGGGNGGSGGGFFPGSGNGSNGSMPNIDRTLSGNGTLNSGSNNYRLRSVRLQVNNGQCRVQLTPTRGGSLEFSGEVNRRSRSCNLNSANTGSVTAQAQFTFNGDQLTGVSMDGIYNGNNFNASFQGQ
jgi:hypothetical protein